VFSIRGPLANLLRMQKIAAQHGWYLNIKECEIILRKVSDANHEFLTLFKPEDTDDSIWRMIEANMPEDDELRDN